MIIEAGWKPSPAITRSRSNGRRKAFAKRITSCPRCAAWRKRTRSAFTSSSTNRLHTTPLSVLDSHFESLPAHLLLDPPADPTDCNVWAGYQALEARRVAIHG